MLQIISMQRTNSGLDYKWPNSVYSQGTDLVHRSHRGWSRQMLQSGSKNFPTTGSVLQSRAEKPKRRHNINKWFAFLCPEIMEDSRYRGSLQCFIQMLITTNRIYCPCSPSLPVTWTSSTLPSGLNPSNPTDLESVQVSMIFRRLGLDFEWTNTPRCVQTTLNAKVTQTKIVTHKVCFTIVISNLIFE